MDDRLRYQSCKTTELATALKVAEEWYKSLLREQQSRRRQHPVNDVDPTMSEKFNDYRRTLRAKQARYVDWRWNAIRDFWGRRKVLSVTPAVFHEFFALRRRHKISNHTLHKDVTLVRQILKYCAETGLLTSFPVIPRVGKIATNPRKWLDQSQWKRLLAISEQRIKDSRNNRLRQQRQDCHDFAVFMVHSMMRVDEVRQLTFEDCRAEKRQDGETILRCSVRKGKTGPRDVVCLSGAASVFKRRQGEHDPSARLFPRSTTRAFRELLIAANLYRDGDDRTRNLKSLRATGISFRVLDGSANITLIARNSGTSINSIDKFYAKYLRSSDDVEALTRIRKR